MIIINSYKVMPGVAGQNLLARSEELATSPWQFTGAVLANQIAAPDGTTTADRYTTANASFGGLLRYAYVYSAQQYTASVHLKKGNADYIGLRVKGPGSSLIYPTVNLANNTTSANGVTSITHGVTVLSDGWVRFWVTYTATAGASFFDIAIAQSNGNINYTPAGTENVYVWGAQLNTGALRTYTKTTATNIP